MDDLMVKFFFELWRFTGMYFDTFYLQIPITIKASPKSKGPVSNLKFIFESGLLLYAATIIQINITNVQRLYASTFHLHGLFIF